VKTPLEALQGVANAAQPLPNMVTGGQPTAAQFQALKEAGVEVVLDIRDPMEPRPLDQPATLQALGMEYLVIPVTAASMDEETLERLLAVVRANAHRSMLFHCASGNRVAGAMIPHLILDHGFSEEEAVNSAMRMGLRGAEVLEWGLDYARRKGQPGR
jgi:protein tyrosine phosphatase (PTP) superfamily phosphohydrolase (DUF442 family)